MNVLWTLNPLRESKYIFSSALHPSRTASNSLKSMLSSAGGASRSTAGSGAGASRDVSGGPGSRGGVAAAAAGSWEDGQRSGGEGVDVDAAKWGVNVQPYSGSTAKCVD